jgi:hypothetical protein
MSLGILPYAPEAIPAVRAFNQRLAAGGAAADHEQFPESPDPGWMPGLELFLAVEEGSVRGGYMLRRQNFSVAGATVTAAHYRLPVSEGLVNRAYAMLGLRLVRDALAREPRLYAMGMAGWDKPLPQMLKRLGWSMAAIPFHFKVVHPARFLRHIRALRTSPLRRAALDLAAFTGAGWLGMKAIGIVTDHTRRLPPTPVDLAPAFTPWADEVWERSRSAYALLAERDAATLDRLYPPSDARFLRVRAAGGWAVLLDTQMHDHKQFGGMRVGSIVDCLGPPESAAAIVRASASLLERRGVDLIVSNQSHAAWSGALLASGFRTGPSNYLLALSPAFAQAVGQAGHPLGPPVNFHFNRGDGDGPIHL